MIVLGYFIFRFKSFSLNTEPLNARGVAVSYYIAVSYYKVASLSSSVAEPFDFGVAPASAPAKYGGSGSATLLSRIQSSIFYTYNLEIYINFVYLKTSRLILLHKIGNRKWIK